MNWYILHGYICPHSAPAAPVPLVSEKEGKNHNCHDADDFWHALAESLSNADMSMLRSLFKSNDQGTLDCWRFHQADFLYHKHTIKCPVIPATSAPI